MDGGGEVFGKGGIAEVVGAEGDFAGTAKDARGPKAC
jgi:hypothetical protein